MLWRVRSRRPPPAGFILHPLLVDKPPSGLSWLHEVKHDGWRIIARKNGSRVTLWSRYGTNFTDRLPKIADGICSLGDKSALIDGEAVAFRPAENLGPAQLKSSAQPAPPPGGQANEATTTANLTVVRHWRSSFCVWCVGRFIR
jgi:hypothetical protein